MPPIILESVPPTPLGLLEHLHLMHHKIVGPVTRNLALAHVPAHGDIQQHNEVRHAARPRGDRRLHHRPPVDPPDHAALAGSGVLHPRELEADRAALRHPLHGRAHDTVLVFVLRRVEAPVQARVVDTVAVPCLSDVDFAVRRPREGLEGQEPECGPDTRCAREGERGDEAALRAGETLARDEARRAEFLGGVGMVGL